MRRLVLIVACGLTQTACANYLPSFPSFGFLKSSPATEQLRIDSEPQGAEAKSSQGSTCQTPCELSVASGSDFVVTVSMPGYQPFTMPVRPESPGGQLQPNPRFCRVADRSAVAGKEAFCQEEIKTSPECSMTRLPAVMP
jgi:hypothetical protein